MTKKAATPATKNDQTFSKSTFLQAKVLDNLAGIAHEQRNLFSGIGQDEVADAYEEVSSKLHAAARELFPLYPHPEYTSDAVQDWLRENNFEG